MLIVVVYHYVRAVFGYPFPGIHGVTPFALEAQLRLLGRVGEFVSISQIGDAVSGAASLPERALLVTFDDGLREQIDHALPILDRLGIPAVFFVNTWPIAQRAVSTVHKIHLLLAHVPPATLSELLDTQARRDALEVRLGTQPAEAAANYPWDSRERAELKYFLNHQLAPAAKDQLIGACFSQVFGDDETVFSRDLYMNVEQLQGLAARGYLGTHGDRHLPLGHISRAAIQNDVRLSLDQLAGWTGVRPFALSYPFGSLEASTLEAGAVAADLGVRLAFTVERAANVDLNRPLHLARFDCNDLPGGRQPCFAADSLFEQAPPARWYR